MFSNDVFGDIDEEVVILRRDAAEIIAAARKNLYILQEELAHMKDGEHTQETHKESLAKGGSIDCQ